MAATAFISDAKKKVYWRTATKMATLIIKADGKTLTPRLSGVVAGSVVAAGVGVVAFPLAAGLALADALATALEAATTVEEFVALL